MLTIGEKPVLKTDAQIQRDVLDELDLDDDVDVSDVGVIVHHGTVTLTGMVSSVAERHAAAAAAHRVAGVRDVANDLRVEPAGEGERSDADIADGVRQALVWDTFVPHESIQSTVTHGVVLLTGEVDDDAQRQDAARAVGYLEGVRGVDNRIVLRPPHRDPIDCERK